MRSRRSEAASGTVDASRTMLCVRNPASGVIYHLVFEGSLRKISGEQLKQHIESICRIPAEDQMLTYNGLIVDNDSTGASLGLYDKSVLDLHISGSSCSPKASASQRFHVKSVPTTTTTTAKNDRNNNLANEHLNRSEHSDMFRNSRSEPQGTQAQTFYSSHQADPRLHSTDAKDSADLKETFDHLYNHKKDPLKTRNDGHASIISQQSPRQRDHDEEGDIVIGIEEDAIDDVEYAMQPFKDADLLEEEIEQKEYVWKMEQLRFETERMNRKHELLRQCQMIESEAESLEREGTIWGRRALLERRKLWELSRWVREEMDMEARVLHMHKDLSSHRCGEVCGGSR